LTGTAPGLGDGKEGPIRPTAEIALDISVLLRLQVTLKGLCGDMFVRRNQRCGALCGASAASVNAPFFFSELRRPCAVLAAAGSMHPNRLWPSQVWLAVQRFAAAQRFNVVS